MNIDVVCLKRCSNNNNNNNFLMITLDLLFIDDLSNYINKTETCSRRAFNFQVNDV